MLSSTLTLPRLLLLVVLGCAGLVWTVAGTREAHPAVARIDNPFSMWSMLRRVGCSPPNQRGTFIAASLLPDATGTPYIFECTPDGLVINATVVQ